MTEGTDNSSHGVSSANTQPSGCEFCHEKSGWTCRDHKAGPERIAGDHTFGRLRTLPRPLPHPARRCQHNLQNLEKCCDNA